MPLFRAARNAGCARFQSVLVVVVTLSASASWASVAPSVRRRGQERKGDAAVAFKKAFLLGEFGIRYARAREGCSAQNHQMNHPLGAPPEKVYEALADVTAKDPLFAAGMDLRLP